MQSSLNLGLEAYWKLDESPQTSPPGLADSVGGNFATVNGTSTTAVGGRINNAHTFNGNPDWLSVPNSASLQLKPAMTLAAWIKTTDAGASKFIMGKVGTPGSTAEYALIMNNGLVRVVLYDSSAGLFLTSGFSTTSIANNPANGGWHLVVGTFNTTSPLAQIYVDGVLQIFSSTTTGTQSVAGTGVFSIGQRPDFAPNWFVGAIDEVGVWNRVLTGPEITTLYNCGNGNQHPFGPATSPCP